MFLLYILINGFPGFVSLFVTLPNAKKRYLQAVTDNMDENTISNLKRKYILSIIITILFFITGFFVFPPVRILKF